MPRLRQGWSALTTLLGTSLLLGERTLAQPGVFPPAAPRNAEVRPEVPAPRSLLAWSVESPDLLPAGRMQGESVVGPDGRIELGPYGTVHVAGLPMSQTRTAIQDHLNRQLRQARIAVYLVRAQACDEPVAQPIVRVGRVVPLDDPATVAPRMIVPAAAEQVGGGELVGDKSDMADADPLPEQMPGAPAASSWRPIDPVIPSVAPPLPSAIAWRPMPVGNPAPQVVSAQPEPVPFAPRKLLETAEPEAAPSPRIEPVAADPPRYSLGNYADLPRELARVNLPPYVIDAPDVLLIESTQALPDQAIRGQHLVRPDGTVSLGIYGSVRVAGLTLEQAREAIGRQLALRINLGNQERRAQSEGISREADTKDKLAQALEREAKQAELLKMPDEAVRKLDEARKLRLEVGKLRSLAQELDRQAKTELDLRNLHVDVLAYNSKHYYVITDGGGYGEQVTRLPITGNETVLDAISQIGGLHAVASKHHIWVARTVNGHSGMQQLPVDWIGITQYGRTETNYQIMPNDRVYVKAQKLVTVDTALARILSPFERLLGITLLGSTTVNSIQQRGPGFGNNR
jgi:protein involved in polysaccharide export with SLBB domain